MNTPPVVNAEREGEDFLPLSALNDLLYCDRRCWLHRVAGLDADNAHTLLGTFDHEKADTPGVENRPGVRIERALPVRSRALGLIGRADVVEFHLAAEASAAINGPATVPAQQVEPPDAPSDTSAETPYPIDYKHGPRRKWDNDDVQLCAQALCLEEMLGVAVPAGAIFHAGSKRRREVAFTEDLRRKTRAAAAALHALVRTTQPPPAILKPQCDGCAMRGHCLPEAGDVRDRLRTQLSVLYQT